MASPSTRAKKLTSSPAIYSSMTIAPPASPKPPSNTASRAACASASLSAMITPLPAASPSALITTGRPKSARAVSAASRSGARAARAGGMEWAGGGGNGMAGAQILGETLRPFELGGNPAGAEGGDSDRPQIIGEPIDQRR